jgi:alpha-galactosidase
MIPLRSETTEVVVDTSTGVPAIVHWGEPLGCDADLEGLAIALDRQPARGGPTVVAPIMVVPEHGSGFDGRPGLLGRRPDATAWSPRFAPGPVTAGEGWIEVGAVDGIAELELVVRFELGPALVVTASVTNRGSTPYLLDGLTVTLPLPAWASELLTFQGRWSREMGHQRVGWERGAVAVENPRGRTSHQHPPQLFAGSPGFA